LNILDEDLSLFLSYLSCKTPPFDTFSPEVHLGYVFGSPPPCPRSQSLLNFIASSPPPCPAALAWESLSILHVPPGHIFFRPIRPYSFVEVISNVSHDLHVSLRAFFDTNRPSCGQDRLQFSSARRMKSSFFSHCFFLLSSVTWTRYCDLQHRPTQIVVRAGYRQRVSPYCRLFPYARAFPAQREGGFLSKPPLSFSRFLTAL